MILKVLVENTAISKEYRSIHGLSLYIKTKHHRILFDLGPGKLFLENAAKMGVAIEDIDTVIISHGHYDHGGALKLLLEHNQKARIYVKESAFDPYYTGFWIFKAYIGLDKTLINQDRIILTKDSFIIDDELQVFSGVKEHKLLPGIKKQLYKKTDKKYMIDTFEHEQNLLIHENNQYTLVAGCAHNGIVNIMERAETITGTGIDTVIGGFHLFTLSLRKPGNIDYLKRLTEALKQRKSQYYTCHCTGTKVFNIIHNEMGDRMNYISSGSSFEIGTVDDTQRRMVSAEETGHKDCYLSDYCYVDYRQEMKAVFLQWKKFSSGDNYRKPLNYVLELLRKYHGTSVICDASNGFEDEKDDVDWAFRNFIPSMAKTGCKNMVFITAAVNPIEGEINMFTAEFMKYFKVYQCCSLDDARDIIQNSSID